MPSQQPSRNTIIPNTKKLAGRAQLGKLEVRDTWLLFGTQVDYVIVERSQILSWVKGFVEERKDSGSGRESSLYTSEGALSPEP